MNIDATSREAPRTNLGRVAGIASSMQLRDHVETTLLGADAERRGRLINMLTGPHGYEVGQYIQNLVLVECNKWLIDAPDAYVAMYLIAQRSRNLRLFHIGYNSYYLDWEMLPRRMQALLMRLMRQVRTVILEGIKNLPLALFYSLDNVQCLDLAMVKLAPMCPRYAIPPNSTPRPAPRSLTVHTRIAKEWKDDECDWTLDTVRYLKGYPSIRFNELRTLYLDFLGCSGCTKMWKEVVALCKDTLVSLKLNYSYEGNGDELIDLSTLRAIRDLHLSVVANPLAIMSLALQLNTLRLPDTHLLKLGLYIDDRYLTSADNWTNLLSRERGSFAEYCKIMDTKIFDILSMYTDTEIRFGLSAAGRSDQGAAKAFIEKVLPRAIRSSKFRFESVGDEFPMTFSMSPHIRASI
ncbi:hypothetical protein AX14_012549 [Amanita brunnescens Koide BX004]|nr:hypothetical protein AX14_012549 [Amanita brunnescens Koide BX004]